jgi:hypothetical protein
VQYLERKAHYAATIKREKLRSWKEYCNITTAAKPWNEVYKLAAGKRRYYSIFTSLREPDGTLTTDMEETVKLTLEHSRLKTTQKTTANFTSKSEPSLKEP